MFLGGLLSFSHIGHFLTILMFFVSDASISNSELLFVSLLVGSLTSLASLAPLAQLAQLAHIARHLPCHERCEHFALGTLVCVPQPLCV